MGFVVQPEDFGPSSDSIGVGVENHLKGFSPFIPGAEEPNGEPRGGEVCGAIDHGLDRPLAEIDLDFEEIFFRISLQNKKVFGVFRVIEDVIVAQIFPSDFSLVVGGNHPVFVAHQKLELPEAEPELLLDFPGVVLGVEFHL